LWYFKNRFTLFDLGGYMLKSNKNESKTPPIMAPKPTIRRLPLYINVIRQMKEEGKESVSCTDIGEKLSLTPIQVRKDIEFTGIRGKPKIGYPIDSLVRTIENFLGWNRTDEALLVGVGHLGMALLGYQGFTAYGLKIVKAFDTDPAKIGNQFFGKEVLDITKLPEVIKKKKIKICILSVPGVVAQEIVDVVVKAGIRGIWNFAPTHLVVPEGVILLNENLAASLSVLTSQLELLQDTCKL
jgi:redox-sensing transcriptional repressor